MNDAQIFMQSLVENATAACRTLIEENNKNYVDKKFKNFKVDGSQIKANTTPSTAIKDDTLHLAKFKYLQSDFASFFAVETNTLLADWVKTGHLNTEDVQIYAGSNLRFLINGEGIFGFHSPSAGVIDTTSYVKFSESGVSMVKNDITLIELDWNGMRFFELENGVAYESLIADSTGKLWLKRKLTVGEDQYDGLVLDGVQKALYSSKYASGAMGTGFYIDGTRAEFGNIRARGTLTATVFEHDKLSSVGGSLYVSPSLISSVVSPVSTVTVDTVDYYFIALTFAFSGEDHYAAGQNWTVGDLLSIQGLIELSTGVYEIRDFRCKITSFTATGCTLQSLSPISEITTYDSDTGEETESPVNLSDGNITPNSAFIFLGSVGSGGEILRRGILITATDPYGPYMDIYDSDETSQLPKGRFGRVDGISDPDLREQPSGYGAYIGNLFAKGHIYANGGRIGGYNIDAHTLTTLDGTVGLGDTSASSPAGDWAFWCGNVVAGSAPFRVDKNGHIYIGTADGNHLSYDGNALNAVVNNLDISANGKAIIKGNASLELESTGSLVAKAGSTLEFQSDSTTTFKSGSDMIFESGAKLKMASADDIEISAGKTLSAYAGEEITFAVGRAGNINILTETAKMPNDDINWAWPDPAHTQWVWIENSEDQWLRLDATSLSSGEYVDIFSTKNVIGGSQVSFYVDAHADSSFTLILVYYNGSSWWAQDSGDFVASETGRFGITKTVPTDAVQIRAFIHAWGSKIAYVRMPKLEYGQPTGWTSNPKDSSSGVKTPYISILEDSVEISSNGKLNLDGATVNVATNVFTVQNADRSRTMLDLTETEMNVGADKLAAIHTYSDVPNTFVGGTIPWVGSVDSSLNSIGKWLLADSILTVPPGTYPGFTINGFKGATLTIILSSGTTIVGIPRVYHCDDVVIHADTINTAYMVAQSASYYYAYISACRMFRMENVNISGYAGRTNDTNGTQIGITLDATTFILTNCCIDRTNGSAAYATNGSSGVMSSCFGGVVGGSDPSTVANLGYGVYSHYASHVAVISTTFASVSGDPSYFATLFSSSPTVTGSYGTIPAAPSTRTYAVSEGYYGESDFDGTNSITWYEGKPKQGTRSAWVQTNEPYYGDGVYIDRFDFGVLLLTGANSIVSDIPAGKTITAATFTLRRDASAGTANAVECTLYQHDLGASAPSGKPNDILFAAAATTISITPGAEATITLNASTISNLNSGACSGFGVRQLGEYARYDIYGTLTVTYA